MFEISYTIEEVENKYYLKTNKNVEMCVCNDKIIAETIKLALEEMLESCVC